MNAEDLKPDPKEWLDIVEDSISCLVVFAMLVYGTGKGFQFEGAVEKDIVFSQASGMELMWAFYDYSDPYAIAIGACEVLGGILILIRRTRIIGCLLTSAILFNIILQDYFYGVTRGALKAAVLYQLIIFAILWMQRKKFSEVIRASLKTDHRKSSSKKIALRTALVLGLFVLLRILEYYMVMATDF